METVRTAPLGSLALATGIGFDAEHLANLITNPSVAEAATAAGIPIPFALSATYFITRQLKLRKRIEKNVAERGFDERFFERTTHEWCARQTARTTLKNTEFIEEYKALCERHKDSSELSWLPHL
ncbi:MAG TPA: hypothetical protein VHB72_00820 [Candidatus Saccharimonadales bacterium]|nr:hypothetical protein [Candidatus Saccharimonadales bacterium]